MFFSFLYVKHIQLCSWSRCGARNIQRFARKICTIGAHGCRKLCILQPFRLSGVQKHRILLAFRCSHCHQQRVLRDFRPLTLKNGVPISAQKGPLYGNRCKSTALATENNKLYRAFWACQKGRKWCDSSLPPKDSMWSQNRSQNVRFTTFWRAERALSDSTSDHSAVVPH